MAATGSKWKISMMAQATFVSSRFAGSEVHLFNNSSNFSTTKQLTKKETKRTTNKNKQKQSIPPRATLKQLVRSSRSLARPWRRETVSLLWLWRLRRTGRRLDCNSSLASLCWVITWAKPVFATATTSLALKVSAC